MNFLSKLFAGKKAEDDKLSAAGDKLREDKLSLSHTAVTQFLEGKMSGQEMMARLMAGFVIVPLAKEPKWKGSKIEGWNPAIVGNADGSKGIVVFTNSEAHLAFAEQSNHRFALTTGTDWVLDVLPPDHDLIFNWGTAHQLKWSAEGIHKFKSEVTGFK